MRFARLAVEAHGRTLEVTFHPRLTVITGVGSATRESMIHKLLSGLCTHRSGTHLELETDAGRTLVVFRPTDAPHRVIDVATGSDVSAEFSDPKRSIDLLAPFGLDAATTRRWSRIGPNDLVASSQNQQLIARLGQIDQGRLWSDAQRVQVARRALSEHADVEEVEDTALTERIDHNYHAHDSALEQADRTRLLAMVVGTVGLLAAALIVLISPDDTAPALLAVGIALAATIVAFVFRARVNYFKRQLDEALGESGSDSYLGYQLDRIDGYINSEHHRRHRAAVQSDVDDALQRWHQTAGDVNVDWALEHRPAIEAAAGLTESIGRHTSGANDLVPRHARDEAPELIDTLITRITRNRHLGANGESFPLLLDEPFGALDPAVRPVLLGTLLKQAGSPQIVVLTNSEDIVSWARLEELTGALGLVGPGEGSGGRHPGDVEGAPRPVPPRTADDRVDRTS